VRFFRRWSSRLLAFELSDCFCRIRGLPKRRSPAVAPVSTPGTTVCPQPILTLTSTYVKTIPPAASCSTKVWQLLRFWSKHRWNNSFHVRFFSAGWSTSETSGCSSCLRIRVQCHQKVCVISRPFVHRRCNASSFFIRDAKTRYVW
jgi:hypothetical protein